jgi:hypothetical protein
MRPARGSQRTVKKPGIAGFGGTVAVGANGWMGVDFRILGPFEVAQDGRSLGLGGAQQRALLAVLLIRHGEVV